MNTERDIKARAVSNWLANVIAVLQESYRRPNYPELIVKLTKIDGQIPEVKRFLIYLMNTRGDQ